MGGHIVTESTKEKLRFIAKNDIVGMKGKKHTEETKIKMRKNMKGKKRLDTTKIKKVHEISILCIETNKIYSSIKNASDDLHINRSDISWELNDNLNHKYNYSSKYHFEYINKDKIKIIQKICINCETKYIARQNNSSCCCKSCSNKISNMKHYEKKNKLN